MPSAHDVPTLRKWTQAVAAESGIKLRTTHSIKYRIWKRTTRVVGEFKRLRHGWQQAECLERNWNLTLHWKKTFPLSWRKTRPWKRRRHSWRRKTAIWSSQKRNWVELFRSCQSRRRKPELTVTSHPVVTVVWSPQASVPHVTREISRGKD